MRYCPRATIVGVCEFTLRHSLVNGRAGVAAPVCPPGNAIDLSRPTPMTFPSMPKGFIPDKSYFSLGFEELYLASKWE